MLLVLYLNYMYGSEPVWNFNVPGIEQYRAIVYGQRGWKKPTANSVLRHIGLNKLQIILKSSYEEMIKDEVCRVEIELTKPLLREIERQRDKYLDYYKRWN